MKKITTIFYYCWAIAFISASEELLYPIFFKPNINISFCVWIGLSVLFVLMFKISETKIQYRFKKVVQ